MTYSDCSVIDLCLPYLRFFFFFFNDTATTEIYTLSLHDALPIFFLLLIETVRQRRRRGLVDDAHHVEPGDLAGVLRGLALDRKSTRLNSSHLVISYAVFCLKKKKKIHDLMTT